jgi:hypothetical protein
MISGREMVNSNDEETSGDKVKFFWEVVISNLTHGWLHFRLLYDRRLPYGTSVLEKLDVYGNN